MFELRVDVAVGLGPVHAAAAVSFLIADMSGRALVRLAHVPLGGGKADSRTPLGRGERRDDEESATVLPFDGGPEEQAVRTQTVQVLRPDPAQAGHRARGWWRVLAPVTERGESVGLLQLYLQDEPAPETLADIAQVAYLLAFVVIANRRHRPVRVGPAQPFLQPVRGDSATAAPRPTDV